MLSNQIRMFRWLGIAGILGAAILFIGDILYLYDSSAEVAGLKSISDLPDGRFLASGISALIGGWLYTLGAGQLYFALRPSGKLISILTFGFFAAIMIGYGIAHAAFFSIISGAKDAFLTGAETAVLTELPKKYFYLLVQILTIPGVIAAILFVYAILFRKTHYPKWIVVLFPLFLFLLKDMIVEGLTGMSKAVLNGGYENMIMLLFFLVSTIVLWNGGKIAPADQEYNPISGKT